MDIKTKGDGDGDEETGEEKETNQIYQDLNTLGIIIRNNIYL